MAFLTAALTLAGAAERAGLADRAAGRLACLARGSGRTLYVLVCVTCALATAVVSLDGAVVLMVPLALALVRRHGAPLGPLLVGTVAVASAASIAVPQGNPANLVLIERLGISPAAFAARMALPGLAAALVCAGGAAALERRALGAPIATASQAAPLTPRQRQMAAALGLERRSRPDVPVRLAVQLIGLLVLVGALGTHPALPAPSGPLALVALALAIGAASALLNNLPVSVSAGSLLSAEPSGYAATVGLGVGALATPQGSVATLLVTERAGCRLSTRRLAPLAIAGVLAAAVVLAAMG